MEVQDWGVTELVTYKTVKRAHPADKRQGRERANKRTREENEGRGIRSI